uniref:HTH 3-helical bundle domain-containing protein n=1 Tax=Aegilops tauschii subsp. strangulata TaxID=200361 RepID=A0A453QSR8_AEGTS
MNQRVNQEWNPSEVEGARSIIARLNNYYNNDGTNHEKNKKHDIMANLKACFPRKTMQQVTDLYDDLVMEMHMLQWPEKEYNGSNSDHGVIYTVDGLVNKNFGLQEEVSMEGMGILFGLPLESMQTMEIQEEVQMVEENKVVLENKMCIPQPVLAPRAKGFWTPEEHRLFMFHPS